ncbi:Conserved_hypothetical protein [Hexamita inflata]|uniref:Uncharacterized protein n=1 Tax=Hexamita inflata TaxID=28002 RepID=A0AA86QW10_9EUKA|nr:Conserved hypothetical protein [Hexamita inflata]
MSNNLEQQNTESSSSIAIEISSSSNTDNEPHAQSYNINISNPKSMPKCLDTDIEGLLNGNTQISSVCKDDSSETIDYNSSEQDNNVSILTGEANYIIFNQNNYKSTPIVVTENILKQFISELDQIMVIIKKERKTPEQKLQELHQLSFELQQQSQKDKRDEQHVIDIYSNMDKILEEKDPKKIYQYLKELKETAAEYQKEIMPVDVDKLNGLLEQTQTDQYTLQGKDVVLILGNMRAGKTTAIHFLAGEKMELVDQTLKARQEQQIDTQMQQQLTDLDKGITKFVKINRKNNDVYLLDTQGLDQSGTSENDIVNKQSLINSIQCCKSVKPVVIISKNSVGDRLTHVYQLFTNLQRIFQNFDKAIPSITYLFTQYSDNEQHQLLADFKNKLKNLNSQEKNNKSYNNFIKDIINKLVGVDKISFSSSDEDFSDKEQQNNESRLLLNPAQDNNLDILDYLLQKQIENPAQKFKNFVSNEAISKLETQFNLHEKCIIEGISKANYQLVKFKLDQLCLLSHYLNIQKFTAMYQKCQTEIVIELKNIGKQYLFQIEQHINNENDNTEQHEITATKLLQLEQLIQYHVFDKKQSEVCIKQSIQMLQDYFKLLQKEIESDQPFSKQHVLNIMKTIRDSASKLGSNSQVEHIYGEACNFVYKAYAKLEQDTATLFKEFTVNNTLSIIEKYGNALNKMQNIYQSCGKLINLDYSPQYSSLQIIDDYITDQLKQLAQDNAKQDTTQTLSSFLSVQNILKVLSESKMLQNHINQEKMLKYNNDLQSCIIQFVNLQKTAMDQQFQDIESGLQEITCDSLQYIEMQITQLLQLVGNKQYNSVQIIVQQCCQMIQSYAENLLEKIIRAIKDIDNNIEYEQQLISDILLLDQFDERFTKFSKFWYQCQSQILIQQLIDSLKSAKTYSVVIKIQQFPLYGSEQNLQSQLSETISAFTQKDLNSIEKINSDINTCSCLQNLKYIVASLSDLKTRDLVSNNLERTKRSLIDNIQYHINQFQLTLLQQQKDYDKLWIRDVKNEINELNHQIQNNIKIMRQIFEDLGQEPCYNHLKEQITKIIAEWSRKVEKMNNDLKNRQITNVHRDIDQRQFNPEHNKVNVFNLDCKLKPVEFNLQRRK